MLGRAWAWWRRRTTLIDFLFMLPIAAISVLAAGSSPLAQLGGLSEVLFFALVLALCLPLIWRRRAPIPVFAIIAAVSALQWAAHVAVQPANLAVLVALYTVAYRCSFRWGLAAVLVAETGVIMETAQQWGSGWEEMRAPLIVFSVVVAAVWILGIYRHTRRAYLRSLEERAERLERERDTQVQVAMAAERARIARELHDVVAHNVSVIVVQADGAAFAIETDKERAKQALEAISATGRTALAEMRRLLGVLRESDAAGAPGSYAPQPGVEQLTDLVEQVRGSGLPLRFDVRGVPVELPQGLQLAVFRIVQEALTNTLKHGGGGASAHVTLHYGDESVEVRVRDDGRGATAVDDGQGHGLVGMRERAAMYGGSARAHPLPDGGWEVVARLPVREGVKA